MNILPSYIVMGEMRLICKNFIIQVICWNLLNKRCWKILSSSPMGNPKTQKKDKKNPYALGEKKPWHNAITPAKIMKRWQCMVVKNNNRSLTFSSLYLSRAIYIPHYCKFLFQEFLRFVLKSSQTCWRGWSYTKGSSGTSIFELCQPNNKVKPHSLLPG